uniref:SET domain-containing protein n=1 Tax=Corethron hystrix TaxID=216773 RepID=A0A7S1BN93_9STRA|mmetsp:Transcript_33629/g.77608  ORF Transcript_33629/g.77608 Transcript_33629/m.77608 type:complete len:410 (+) Transcript_33629:171-1400(+)
MTGNTKGNVLRRKSRWVSLAASTITFSKSQVSAFWCKPTPGSRNRPAYFQTAPLRASGDGDLTEFKKWCTEKGILTPLDLQIRDEGYRFMTYSDEESFANRPEAYDGLVLRVPLEACLTADSPEELAKALAQEKERGEESSFAPYLKVLPALDAPSLRALPRFWSADKTERVRRFDGGQIDRRVRADARIELDPWAHACVASRANYLADRGYAMTPLLDMMNHDAASETSARIVDDALCLAVGRPAKEGEEVFLSYGDLTNIDTLCDYGFVAENGGRRDEVVDVRMIRKSPVRVVVSEGSDGGASLDAGSLAVLRSRLAPPEEVANIIAGNEYISMTTVFTKPISDSSEEEVFSLVAHFVDEAICQGNEGIEWAKENDENMLERYFVARVKVLKKGLDFIKIKFPDLLY